MEWYLKVVRDNYANFSGRARRKEYWMFVLFNFIIGFILGLIDGVLGISSYDAEYSILANIYSWAVAIPTIAVAIRRVHDVGKSGWYMLIPFYNFILVVTDSEPGNNQYGPNPKTQRAEFEESTVVEPDPESYDNFETGVDEASDIPEPIILTVESGPNKGSFYPVSLEATIGRAHDNDIVMGLKTISGYHCKISIEGGQFVLNDLGSTNGTIVDGEKVNRAVIKDGTEIELSKIRLKVAS